MKPGPEAEDTVGRKDAPGAAQVAAVVLFFVLLLAGVTWLLSETPGGFSEADLEQAAQCRTLAELEAQFGLPLPDGVSGFGGEHCPKVWKGVAWDMIVVFDKDGRPDNAVLQPRYPVRIIWLLAWMKGSAR